MRSTVLSRCARDKREPLERQTRKRSVARKRKYHRILCFKMPPCTNGSHRSNLDLSHVSLPARWPGGGGRAFAALRARRSWTHAFGPPMEMTPPNRPKVGDGTHGLLGHGAEPVPGIVNCTQTAMVGTDGNGRTRHGSHTPTSRHGFSCRSKITASAT